jgi:hypothetical protein
LSSIVKEFGKHPILYSINKDGGGGGGCGTWYPPPQQQQACRFMKLKHHLQYSYEKSLDLVFFKVLYLFNLK